MSFMYEVRCINVFYDLLQKEIWHKSLLFSPRRYLHIDHYFRAGLIIDKNVDVYTFNPCLLFPVTLPHFYESEMQFERFFRRDRIVSA